MKSKALLSILLIGLFILTAAAPSMGVDVDRSVMDKSLLERLDAGQQRIEVLVRFNQPVSQTHLHRLRTAG
ncbi:MAG: hypothetical protein QCI38_02495, partial [Candidatus Thermoplasmatota archaeon]|nr:hypothetical protein [Candidatus Thermoplasmatota archaeon]